MVFRICSGYFVGGKVGNRQQCLFPSPDRADELWGPPSHLFSGYWLSSTGSKAAGAYSSPLMSIWCCGYRILWKERQGTGNSVCSLPQTVQTSYGAHPATCSVGTVYLPPVVKRPERIALLSCPYSVVVTELSGPPLHVLAWHAQ